MKALTNEAHLKLCFYDGNKPIKVPSEQRFSFLLANKDSVTFHFSLSSDFEEIDFDIKMLFGKVTIGYSNKIDNLNPEIEITGSSQ